MTTKDATSPGRPGIAVVTGPPLTSEPGLGSLTMPGYLREVTARYAERQALVFHHPDGTVERWTYAELWERSVEVARALISLGVGKDSRVGVMMTNRPEWLAAFFGVGLAGGVAATISTFSTAYELEHLLKVSGVSVLLFEGKVLKRDFTQALTELAPDIGNVRPGDLASAKLPFLRRFAVVGGGACGAIESWSDFLALGRHVSPDMVTARCESVTPADLAAIFFSSGSTGKPKGILCSHRAVAVQCWRWPRIMNLQDNVRCWSANGFFFSGNFAMALGAALSCGGCLVLQATFDPPEALRLMQAEKVTFARAWPHQWAQLRALPQWADADLSSFRYVDRAYTDPQPTVATSWTDPNWSFGATETFTIVSAFPSGTPEAVVAGSHGAPLAGCTIKIVDPLTGLTAPLGQLGEVAVKGPTLMLGYVGEPLSDTLDPEGFFRTGDGGWLDPEGRLHWQGRMNDIIKTGGANVSPVEVDAVLGDCPGVKINITIGIPHETLGEMVVSCVVPHTGAPADERAVREFVKQRLASYKVPRRVLFVAEHELALTGSAKIKAGAARELAIKRLGPGGSDAST